jgi:NhaA family Na+:H+ antiporter
MGIFAREELRRSDTLNDFEHWWKNPVEIILGLFGLVNAGVAFSSVGTGTVLVLVGLLIGKPLGITFFTWLGVKFFKLEIPGGMTYRHVVSLGMVAGIGFTVALFVSTAAFPLSKYPQETLDAVKMGALASFFAAVLAYVGARMLGIRRESAVLGGDSNVEGDQPDGDDSEGEERSASEPRVGEQADDSARNLGAPISGEPDNTSPSDSGATCPV